MPKWNFRESSGPCLRSRVNGSTVHAFLALCISLPALMALGGPSDRVDRIQGYAPNHSDAQREWETKFRSIVSAERILEFDKRLSARPHHVGSPYDKDNAEWILANFKQWGYEAHIETFDVLFPTPKERVLEMIAPTKFKAKLQEPALSVDPTSGQTAEQLPTYNAYSIDGCFVPGISKFHSPALFSMFP